MPSVQVSYCTEGQDLGDYNQTPAPDILNIKDFQISDQSCQVIRIFNYLLFSTFPDQSLLP